MILGLEHQLSCRLLNFPAIEDGMHTTWLSLHTELNKIMLWLEYGVTIVENSCAGLSHPMFIINLNALQSKSTIFVLSEQNHGHFGKFVIGSVGFESVLFV